MQDHAPPEQAEGGSPGAAPPPCLARPADEPLKVQLDAPIVATGSCARHASRWRIRAPRAWRAGCLRRHDRLQKPRSEIGIVAALRSQRAFTGWKDRSPPPDATGGRSGSHGREHGLRVPSPVFGAALLRGRIGGVAADGARTHRDPGLPAGRGFEADLEGGAHGRPQVEDVRSRPYSRPYGRAPSASVMAAAPPGRGGIGGDGRAADHLRGPPSCLPPRFSPLQFRRAVARSSRNSSRLV
jgi:hypothetical protein